MQDNCRPRNFEAPEEAQDYLTDEVLRAFHRLRGSEYGITRKPHMSPDRKRIIFTTNNSNILKKSDDGKLEEFEYDGYSYKVRATRPISPEKF